MPVVFGQAKCLSYNFCRVLGQKSFLTGLIRFLGLTTFEYLLNSPYAVDNLTKSPRWLRICNP